MNLTDIIWENKEENPLDNIVSNGGFCGIFRTIACIGDSLSSGELESFIDGKVGYHDYYDISWGQFFARDAGCKVYNFSRGGMTAKEYCEGFAEEKGFYSEELKAQAYIIALGANDCSRVLKGMIEFGSIDDVHPDAPESNAKTFVGYYGKIISDYKKIQPKAKFFLMTMPKDTENAEDRAILYDKFQEIPYQLCEIFDNCYVVDLRKYAPLYDEAFRSKFFLGGHMNSAGYRFTALMVESYIDYIIRHNFEDFSQIGFVGTEFYNEKAKW